MKFNKVIFMASILILMFLMITVTGCSNESATEEKQDPPEQTDQTEPTQPPTVEVPQLNQERAEAATMVLISAPTLQPADHEGRWDPKTKGDSCLVCHEQAEAMGSREIPLNHYVDEDRSKGIFGPRFVCVTCHGLDTGETKAAFNE